MELARPASRPARSRALRRAAATALALATVAAASALPAQAKNPTQAKQPTAEVVTTAQGGGKSVALTFDDGPNPVDTPRLLAVLRANHVKATFCLWGDFVEEHPDVVRQIAAEGHTLCNHTMTHPNLSSYSQEQVRAEIEATTAAIREAVPGAKIPYFRAPYGAWGQSAEVAAELGMQPLGWQSLIFDWDQGTPPQPPSAAVLTENLRAAMQPGAVVLAHDGPFNRGGTVDAVAAIIPEFKKKGWHFTQPEIRLTEAEVRAAERKAQG